MLTPDMWTRLSVALDPWAELPLTAEADRLYVEVGYSPSDAIVRRLKASFRATRTGARRDAPPKFLYCGARGSGKTTQLRRLVRRLSGDAEVLLLDLAPVLPERVSTLQLVTHVGIALLARLGQWEGADGGVSRVLASEFGSGFGKALTEWVGTADLPAVVDALAPLVIATDLASTGAVTTASAVVRAIKAVLPSASELDPITRLARAEKLLRRLDEGEMEQARTLALQVSRLAEALHGRASKPVVVLVDGLDKILGLDDLLGAFDDFDLLRSLSLSIVLTAPSTLSSDVRFVGMRQDLVPLDLQNIPVVTPEGADREDGLKDMVAIAQNRLGPALRPYVAESTLRQAARWSSGIPRDFLSLLSDAALLAEERGADRVTDAHLKEIAKEFRLKLQRPLTLQDLELLEQVRRTRRLDDSDRAQQLLFQNFIAWYPNENGYFRPHELLVDWVQSESARIASLPES